MSDREFKPGVYLLKSVKPPSAPVVWFDGDYFWLCGLEPSNKDDDLSINVDNIGELIWEPGGSITSEKTTAAQMYADRRLEGVFFRHVLTTAQLAVIQQELEWAFDRGREYEKRQDGLRELTERPFEAGFFDESTDNGANTAKGE